MVTKVGKAVTKKPESPAAVVKQDNNAEDKQLQALKTHVLELISPKNFAPGEVDESLFQVKGLQVVSMPTGKRHKKAAVVLMNPTFLKKIRTRREKLRQGIESFLKMPVFLVGERKIVKKPTKRSALAKFKRPYHATLVAVHQAILEDIVKPSEIMNQRMIYRAGSSRQTKIVIDKTGVYEEDKARVDVLPAVYKHLCDKDVSFVFPLHHDPMRMHRFHFKNRNN